MKNVLQKLTELINRTESVHELVKLFFLALQLRTSFGLRVIDNGLGPPQFGAKDSILNFALLAEDQKATLPSKVQTFDNIKQHLSFLSQFTICSSATTNAFLTNLNFFQILRHSGNPWITFFSMPPQPGSDNPIFKLTVKCDF